jgi:hypothetical protein
MNCHESPFGNYNMQETNQVEQKKHIQFKEIIPSEANEKMVGE